MSKGSSVLRQAGLLSVANLAMRGVAMLFQVYLTGQVGAAGVGLLQLILTVNGFAITLGTSGIRVAAMYLSAEEYGLRRPDGVRRAMGWCLAAGLALSVLVGAGMAMGAELLAVRWVKDLRALAALRLLGLAFVLRRRRAGKTLAAIGSLALCYGICQGIVCEFTFASFFAEQELMWAVAMGGCLWGALMCIWAMRKKA